MLFSRKPPAEANTQPPSGPAVRPGRAKMVYARFMNSTATYRGAQVFMGLVLVALAYLFLPFGGSSTGGQATTPATPSVVATTPQNAAPVAPIGGCEPADQVTYTPEQVVGAEMNTTWTAIGEMSVPSSPTGGPKVTTTPAHCFARTPEGALYAAATFVAEMAATTSNQQMIDILSARALQDHNYEAYIRRLGSSPDIVGQPQIAIDGFRWQEFTPQRATVELRYKRLTGAEAGTTSSTLYSVIWAANDWLLLVPNPTESSRLPGDQLRTFHTWGG